ncbi:MAG: D-alanyl-D-alanine carboxypeptidase [Alphaproteobacteria bacterium]|nr:D-alanyl-D-alanine carboxypeptidase [Alphaproteobacteria bacterium]
MRFVASAMLALLLLAAAARADTTIAPNAILVDGTTGTVLLEKNADEPLPPASMSKLMTVLMVFERLKAGVLSMDQTFPVSRKAWKMGGSKTFVRVNRRVSVGDLLRGVIVQSGNDASIVIAEGISGSEEAFSDAMTARARELGLVSASFRNATGWPHPEHVISARDLARLAQILVTEFPEQYAMFAEREFEFNGIKQRNRNPLLGRVPGADGLKTGHTNVSGYGLTASAERDGRRLYLVLNGLQNSRARAREAERLIEWGFREFAAYPLLKKGEMVETAAVWLGSLDRVPLVPSRDVVLSLKRQARSGLKASVRWTGPIVAPVAEGQQLATLRLEAPGIQPVEHPLYAGAKVERVGFFGRIFERLRAMIFGFDPTA